MSQVNCTYESKDHSGVMAVLGWNSLLLALTLFPLGVIDAFKIYGPSSIFSKSFRSTKIQDIMNFSFHPLVYCRISGHLDKAK